MGFYGNFSNPHVLRMPNGIHGIQNFKGKSFLFYHFLCFSFQKIKLEGTFGHFLHESTIYGIQKVRFHEFTHAMAKAIKYRLSLIVRSLNRFIST
jgi:hypothetical protein